MDHDSIWQEIRREAEIATANEPVMAGFMHNRVLRHESLEKAVGHLLSLSLACQDMDSTALASHMAEAMSDDREIGVALQADLEAMRQRDPAIKAYLVGMLYAKGFHAIAAYRVAHWMWRHGRIHMAHFLQHRSSVVFGTDIHPAARIGTGILLDHATGFVVGETATIGNNVSILHEVTLGGTGKESGDRHPKVGDWVMIGAGAKLLGNIHIGEGAKIGAGSVVLRDIPAHCTAAGVPAKVVGHPHSDHPAEDMDQTFRS